MEGRSITRWLFAVCLAGFFAGLTHAQDLPNIFIRETVYYGLPGVTDPALGFFDSIDCNSPLHWDERGNLYLFTSVRHAYRTSGRNLFELSRNSERTNYLEIGVTGDKWLEATYRDSDGTLFGWYHNEAYSFCPNPNLSAPRVGMMVSYDEGRTWQDLGIILTAPDSALNCDTDNHYFAGGNGDFSVLLDAEKKYFYLLFGSYHKQIEEQGISCARLSYADRFQPVGKAEKWYQDDWREPGLGGHVTPVFPVQTDWHRANADAYWGPALHYNSYLNMYVMLLNHAVDKYWKQEGIYISYNYDLTNPAGWSTPERLFLDPRGSAYPQVIGVGPGETDKLVGKIGRLFLLGHSYWELNFLRPGETCEDCDRQFAVPGREPSVPNRLPGPVRPTVQTTRRGGAQLHLALPRSPR